jgi:hypothetical protein
VGWGGGVGVFGYLGGGGGRGGVGGGVENALEVLLSVLVVPGAFKCLVRQAWMNPAKPWVSALSFFDMGYFY